MLGNIMQVLRIRNNGKITKIKTPSDKLEVMRKIVKSNVSEVVLWPTSNYIRKFGICYGENTPYCHPDTSKQLVFSQH
jgi:hypothetical protein